jgi:hypothetical protein
MRITMPANKEPISLTFDFPVIVQFDLGTYLEVEGVLPTPPFFGWGDPSLCLNNGCAPDDADENGKTRNPNDTTADIQVSLTCPFRPRNIRQ